MSVRRQTLWLNGLALAGLAASTAILPLPAAAQQQPPSVRTRAPQNPAARNQPTPAPRALPVPTHAEFPNEPTPANTQSESPLPPSGGNSGQMLLKEASDKSKSARNDAELSEVIAIAEEGLKEKPGAEGTAFGRRLLGWAYNKRGQHYAENQIHEAAVEDFTKALEYDPSLWRAVHNRGVSHASSNQPQKSLADFNRALEMNKGYANTWYNRAELFYETGAFDKAYRDFNEALRLNPNDAGFIAGRGKAAARMGKLREAMQDLDWAVKTDPRNAALRMARGDLYLAIKSFPTAAEDYRAAIQLNPQLGPAYRGLAWIMATAPDSRLRNTEAAVSTAQKAMELEGDGDARYVETLAAAFANSGQFEAAAELIKHGLAKAQGETAHRMQAQMATYQEGKPWREGPSLQSPTQATKPPVPTKR